MNKQNLLNKIFALPENEILKIFSQDGNLWEKNGKKRIYFNQKSILSLYGYQISYYGTGNLSNVLLDGKQESNCSTRKMLYEIEDDKYFLDLVTKKISNLSESGEGIFLWVLEDILDNYYKNLETQNKDENQVTCDCGCTVSKILRMSASRGSSCPDCYDRMSD